MDKDLQIKILKDALKEQRALVLQSRDGMKVEQSQLHAETWVETGLRDAIKVFPESHNATPTQHETATSAENTDETDS